MSTQTSTLSAEALYERQVALTRALLKNIGDPGLCKDCGDPIFWVRHLNRKIETYNPDGGIHLCPYAGRHHKR